MINNIKKITIGIITILGCLFVTQSAIAFYNPSQNICLDHNATNYGNYLPCTYYNQNPQYNYQPQAVSGVVSSLKDTSATLHGTVYTNGMTPTYAYFEYGTGLYFGNITTKSPIYNSSSAVVKSISGLNPNTTYYFRMVAENSNGIVRGDIFYFTTAMTDKKIVTPVVVNYTKTTNNSDTSNTSSVNDNSNEKSSPLSASAGTTSGSFLPSTALGWLLMIIFILVLFLIVRYFVTREAPNQLHR